MRSALVFTLLLAAALFAGCTGPGQESTDPTPEENTTTPTGNVTAPPPSNARFVVSNVTIGPKDDANRTTLYEDDDVAIVRYTLSQPDDAPKETAFVTYLLNGRIVDVQQVTLEGGDEKRYERTVTGLRDNRSIKVEVRAGNVVQRAESTVQDWPRAGDAALELGPLSIRADYGLIHQDGRSIVNLSLVNDGPEQPFRDFRVKMLCVLANGTIRETSSVRIDPPSVNNSTSIDVSVAECEHGAYGLEFKATGEGGKTLMGRLLLVEKGWRPSDASSVPQA